uniref:Uncharacterized protein n=1 Tax=Glossina palpalis gambiensis TaxID=67801 RepID=A0A1B0BBD9_9MUSC
MLLTLLLHTPPTTYNVELFTYFVCNVQHIRNIQREECLDRAIRLNISRETNVCMEQCEMRTNFCLLTTTSSLKSRNRTIRWRTKGCRIGEQILNALSFDVTQHFSMGSHYTLRFLISIESIGDQYYLLFRNFDPLLMSIIFEELNPFPLDTYNKA